MSKQPQVLRMSYVPQPRQELLHRSKAQQILYGGAAGGGKSHSLRWDMYLACWENPGCDAYLFRKSRAELENTHIKMVFKELPDVMGRYNQTRNRFEFVNGSYLNMCYVEHPGDAEKYNSCEIHCLGVDEAGQFQPYDLAYLQSRLRTGSWKPVKNVDFFPRCIFSSNPGGPAHNWLKEKFITGAIPEQIHYDETKRSKVEPRGWTTLFIPAKMADNSYLDATYEGAFGDLPEWQRKRLVDGDWDTIEGAYFDCWNPRLHTIRPFAVPDYWTRFQSFDWGHASPFCSLWGTISDGSPLADGRVYPDGALIVYREWYGGTIGKNKGLRLSAHEVGAGIKESEEGEKVSFRVADPAMWGTDSGPSPAEEMGNKAKVYFQKADNERVPGWQQVYTRLKGTFGVPMLYVFETCRALIATLPAVMADERHPEDVAKGGEDHAPDALRYMAMSRPWVTKKAQPKKGVLDLPTMEELTKMHWTREHQQGRAARVIHL